MKPLRALIVSIAAVAAVSHDSRSPLTALRAAVDGLRSASLHLGAADRYELFQTIDVEARRPERPLA